MATNKIQDALNKCFNPVNYSLGRDDCYLISHGEYKTLKKELNDVKRGKDE